MCKTFGCDGEVAVGAVFAVANYSEGICRRRFEIGYCIAVLCGCALLGEVLFAHSLVVDAPRCLVSARDEGEAYRIRASAAYEYHRRIALAFSSAFGSMKNDIVAVRIFLMLHKRVVVERLIVAEERDSLAGS